MSGVRTSGVYQPRKRGAALAETFDNARRQVARLLKVALNRGAGFVVLAAAAAVLVALLSYNPNDPSPNNATARAATNLLGPIGATAADILLQYFGFAALAFLAAPIGWGTRAMMGWRLDYAIPRAVAGPVGTLALAAGLGMVPGPGSCSAGGTI